MRGAVDNPVSDPLGDPDDDLLSTGGPKLAPTTSCHEYHGIAWAVQTKYNFIYEAYRITPLGRYRYEVELYKENYYIRITKDTGEPPTGWTLRYLEKFERHPADSVPDIIAEASSLIILTTYHNGKL